jgi:hypothetical protein
MVPYGTTQITMTNIERFFVLALGVGFAGCSEKVRVPSEGGQQSAPHTQLFENNDPSNSPARVGEKILHCTRVNGAREALVIDVFAISKEKSSNSFQAIAENLDPKALGKTKTYIFDNLNQYDADSNVVLEAKDFRLKVNSRPTTLAEEDLPLSDFRYGRYSAEFRSPLVTGEWQEMHLVCSRIEDSERARWNNPWYCHGKIEPREEGRVETSFGPIKIELSPPNRKAKVKLDDLKAMNEKGWSLQINDSFLTTFLRLERESDGVETYVTSASYEANAISLYASSSSGSVDIKCRR